MIIAEYQVGFHGDLVMAHAGSAAAINQNHRQNGQPEKKERRARSTRPPRSAISVSDFSVDNDSLFWDRAEV